MTDLLVALSATVTGGPFADISTIIKQLNVALDGRTGDVHALLSQLNTLVTGLNAHTDDIDRVLDGMDRLGSALADDAPVLSRAIDDLTPAITTLARAARRPDEDARPAHPAEHRQPRVIGATKESLVRQVNEVGPVLSTLIAQHGQDAPADAGRPRLRQGARLRVARRLRPLRPDRAAGARRPVQPPGSRPASGRTRAVAGHPHAPGLPEPPGPARAAAPPTTTRSGSADCWEVAADDALFANRVRTRRSCCSSW